MRPFVFGIRVETVVIAGGAVAVAGDEVGGGGVAVGDCVGARVGEGDGACGSAGATGNTPVLGAVVLPPPHAASSTTNTHARCTADTRTRLLKGNDLGLGRERGPRLLGRWT